MNLVEGGELETGFASSTYENAMNGSSASDSALAALKKSGAKHNGRLYHFQNIFRSFRKGGEESLYSTATIFKQIFILATAVILCFFAFFADGGVYGRCGNKEYRRKQRVCEYGRLYRSA